MSLEIIIPGCGSTLFSQESMDFPAIRAAQALHDAGAKVAIGDLDLALAEQTAVDIGVGQPADLRQDGSVVLPEQQ